LEELVSVPALEPLLRDFWLPELQVMGARSAEGSIRGFYVAAKGGHNAESHNHNDAGNYIVYHDGLPVLIDVGVGTYTAETFSSRRYEIWTMQSAYHNLPTINGVMQKEGREYQASELSYKSDRNVASLGLNIAGAYPAEAGVRSWRRTVRLERGGQVEIRDKYALGEVKKDLELSLMCWRIPAVEAEGRIRLDLPEGKEAAGVSAVEKAAVPSSKPLYILYDRARFHAAIETITLEDAQLRFSWGNQIYRILLTAKKIPFKGEFSIRVTETQID
jgi:hypothetical protein